MSNYCVYSSSPDSCTKRFCGTMEECEQWITDNKHRFPGYVTLKIQPAEESAKWERDFDIHSGGPVYEQMNKIDDENTTLTFDGMKSYIEREDPDGIEFAHHGPYADYINSFYSKALDGISDEIEFEPNIQNGRGSIRIYGFGLSYEYDYEEECQKLLDIATNSDTEKELESRIKDYVDELISEFEYEGTSDDEYDDDITGNWY